MTEERLREIESLAHDGQGGYCAAKAMRELCAEVRQLREDNAELSRIADFADSDKEAARADNARLRRVALDVAAHLETRHAPDIGRCAARLRAACWDE